MAGKPATGTKFKLDLAKWSEGVEERMIAIARQSFQRIYRQVVITTPVMTGNLRANWQPAIGDSPPASGGDGSKPTVEAVAAGISLGDTLYARNFTVYAMRIEFGFVGTDSLGRYYNQRGQYFVTNAVASWETIVGEVVSELP